MQMPDAEQLLTHLANQIRPLIGDDTALVGIHSGGAWIAERLHPILGAHLPLGTLDISFYRDDFSRIGLHPQVKPSNIPFEVEGAHIILVDDVLYTGRTARAAMNELFDYGRPARITLVALVDRGGREMPIHAEVVGATLDIPPTQNLELTRDARGGLQFKLTGDA
jgi:pyrimidine operon attenuation protein/uracil phosphoribosyltransferase